MTRRTKPKPRSAPKTQPAKGTGLTKLTMDQSIVVRMIYFSGKCENHDGLSDMCMDCCSQSMFMKPALRQYDAFELILPPAMYSLICPRRFLSPLNSAEYFMILTAAYNHVSMLLGFPEKKIFSYKNRNGVEMYNHIWHERIFPLRTEACKLWDINREHFFNALAALNNNGATPFRSMDWIRLLETRILEAQAIMDETNGDLGSLGITWIERCEDLKRDYLTNALFPWTIERSGCDNLIEKQKNVDRWNLLRMLQLKTIIDGVNIFDRPFDNSDDKSDKNGKKTFDDRVNQLAEGLEKASIEPTLVFNDQFDSSSEKLKGVETLPFIVTSGKKEDYERVVESEVGVENEATVVKRLSASAAVELVEKIRENVLKIVNDEEQTETDSDVVFV